MACISSRPRPWAEALGTHNVKADKAKPILKNDILIGSSLGRCFILYRGRK
jgi:hypothetical protein